MRSDEQTITSAGRARDDGDEIEVSSNETCLVLVW